MPAWMEGAVGVNPRIQGRCEGGKGIRRKTGGVISAATEEPGESAGQAAPTTRDGRIVPPNCGSPTASLEPPRLPDPIHLPTSRAELRPFFPLSYIV